MRHSVRFNWIAADRKLLIVLFLFFALSAVAVSCVFFTLSVSKPYIGIWLAVGDQGWTVHSVDDNGLANRAGIREGERPVEVNGQPAEVFLEKYTKSDLTVGRVIRDITVIDDHGQLKSVNLNHSSPIWRAVIEVTNWFIVCLIFWIIGFYVVFRKPNNAAALLLCLCGLTLGLALSGNMAGERGIPTASFLEVVGSVMFPWLLLHFFLVLPEERAWLCDRPLVYLLYFPAAVTLALFPLIGYVDGLAVQWFRTIRLLGYGAGFLGVVSVAIFNYFRFVSFRTRQQMKIVLFSALAAMVPFTILNLVPEVIWGRTILPTDLSVLLLAFIPLGMGYAVVTKKLMDIDVIIRKGVVYGLITVVMAVILSTAIFLATGAPESVGVPEEIALALVLGAIATALFGPARKGIEILVDKLFYKDRYDYRYIIQSLSTSLNLVKDFTDVSRLVVGTMVSTLNLVGGCLFVKGQTGTFQVSAAQGGNVSFWLIRIKRLCNQKQIKPV